MDPDFLKLEKILLSNGGERLIYMPEMPEPSAYLNGKIVKTITKPELDHVRQCHGASIAIATKFKNEGIKMWNGYSLNDGLWRHHSWIEKDGEYIEVTGIQNEKCFGIEIFDIQKFIDA